MPPLGFIPKLPDHLRMPPGYYIEGITGEGMSGRCVTYFYWVREPKGGLPDDIECGDDRTTMEGAAKDAWRHYHARQAQIAPETGTQDENVSAGQEADRGRK